MKEIWERDVFDLAGRALDLEGWCAFYKTYYFLGGPTLRRRINGRNQTSPYIESEAIRILNQACALNCQDLKFVYGWKLGQIDHQASERNQRVIYKPLWDQHLVARTQFGDRDMSSAISQLAVDTSNPSFIA